MNSLTPPDPADLPRRRLLLAAGGLVLLGGCASAGPRYGAGREARTARTSTARLAADTPARAIPHRDEVVASPASPVLTPGDEPMRFIDDGRKAIALTIDDGPSPVYTPQVLRLLDKYKITASFSMIGINVTANPEVAREVAEAGHLIVNHTWRHLDLAVLPPAAVRDEITAATHAIHRATGRVPGMFRAPYGFWSPEVVRLCARMGMQTLDWSVDPRDWSRPGVPEIVSNIMGNTRTGSIILEHDGGGDRSQTVAALGIVIPRLLDAGYRFRTP